MSFTNQKKMKSVPLLKSNLLDVLIKIKWLSLCISRISDPILGAMLRQATYHGNFSYVLEVMDTAIREEISPPARWNELLEEFYKKAKDISNDRVSA